MQRDRRVVGQRYAGQGNVNRWLKSQALKERPVQRGARSLAPAADVAVALTGVTGGQLLPGVMFGSGYAETASLVMSSRHATIRRMTTRHHVVGDPS